MKRFLLVMLSLGLVMAFSASALAVDVKFNGSYYAAGMYLDKLSLDKSGTDGKNLSTAFYYQRLRVKTEFVVAQGLTLITRFDAMERAWGAARSSATTTLVDGGMSAGTVTENENIAFDWAYVEYASPIGYLQAGYMMSGIFGTVFGDTSGVGARIVYSLPIGGFFLQAFINKGTDNSLTAVNNSATQADKDADWYGLVGTYTWKGGEAGLNGQFIRSAINRSTTEANSFIAQYYYLSPFAKVQLGPVQIQTELIYVWGKAKKYDSAIGSDQDLMSLTGWVDATVNMGPVYFGGTFAYVSGEDQSTTDKMESYFTGGRDWNPCLILFNFEDRGKWAGSITGAGGSTDAGTGVTNAFLYQGRVGVKPTEKIDIMASFTYAHADKNGGTNVTEYNNWYSKNYGYEVDVIGTYKITNNLSYMLGVGYLFTGDYFKGTSASATVRDDYLVINKLTLTF